MTRSSGSARTPAFYAMAGDEPSFFDFFDPVDEEDQTHEMLERDFAICQDVSKELIPYAFEYFRAIGAADADN